MTQDGYQTVFEIGLRSFPWAGLLHPAPFILIGLLLVRFSRGRQLYQIAGAVGAILATFFFLLLATSFVPDFLKFRHAYKSGESLIVEGVVENFKPAPTMGALKESFSVHGIAFSYYLYSNSPCFHNAPAYRGPVRPGMIVRIFYSDRCIQRVDIRKQ
jgi:tellurite resistance protein TehA-like permease